MKQIERWRHARGFGVHSPFAFHLITDVIYSKHGYYAFLDIEEILQEKQIDISNFQLHHLTYRLIRHFNPASLLKIGSGGGVNMLYIASAMDNKTTDCFETDSQKQKHTENLLDGNFFNINFIDKITDEQRYNAIIINPENSTITPDDLYELSASGCFWVIEGINSGRSKQFWRKTVILNTVDVTFDMKDIGIVVLNKKLNKRHYLI